ncbi:hypothetical protein V8D89_007080 [Ganoderma adspersum]
MGQSIQTPSRDIQLASDLSPWGSVVIETANQAQNVWHTAIVEGNTYAICFVCNFNCIHQDRTIQCTEGGHLLMRSFPSDSHYFHHKSGDMAQSRHNAHSCTQNADEDKDELDELISDEIHAGPSSEAAIPQSASQPIPLTLSALSSSAPICHVPPATTVAAAWSVRAVAGQQRQLDPLDESITLMNVFAAIPTSEWPITMRNNNGEFPPCGDDVHRIPLIISGLRHSSPAFSQSSPLTRLNGTLLEDPLAPFLFDCTDLVLHHVTAWATSHGIDQVLMLRELVTVYAINTRRRLEGQSDSILITTVFRFAPAHTTDVTPDHHTSLILLHNTLFNGLHCSYDSAPADDVTMASETTVPETTDS